MFLDFFFMLRHEFGTSEKPFTCADLREKKLNYNVYL